MNTNESKTPAERVADSPLNYFSSLLREPKPLEIKTETHGTCCVCEDVRTNSFTQGEV